MQRTIGLTVIGGLFVFSGGVFLLIILIEIIDALTRYGWDSIALESLSSIDGFMRHLALPILLYNTGIGILLLQSWAWRVATYILPPFYVITLANGSTFVLWVIVGVFQVYYLIQPKIKNKFGNVSALGLTSEK